MFSQPIASSARAIESRVHKVCADRGIAAGADFSFRSRGGLGIFLHRGSASFRDVTVTPLPNAPVP